MNATAMKVADLAREGMSDKDVAATLGIAVSTAASYRRRAGLHRSLKRWLASLPAEAV